MDSDLTDGIVNDDRRILHRIYNGTIGDNIRRYVNNHNRNPELAEDVLVLTLIRCKDLIIKGKYNETGKFEAFIMGVAKKILLEEVKLRSRELVPYQEISEDHLWRAPGNEATSGGSNAEIESLFEQVKIKACLAKLGERCRKIIQLFYYEDNTLVDIGKQLKINQPNVTHHRCMKRLKKMVLNPRKKNSGRQ